MLVAPGQGGDAPMFTPVMEQLRVNRVGPNRHAPARTVFAVTTQTHPRQSAPHLRDRGIVALIPQPANQIGHRKRRRSTGDRAPAFNKEDKGRNVERNLNIFKQWLPWRRATTNSH